LPNNATLFPSHRLVYGEENNVNIMKRNMDKYFKEKLESAEMVPPKDLWTKLEGKLDAFEKPIENRPSGSLKFYWLGGMAAAITAIAVMLSYYFWNNTPPNANIIQANVSVEKTNITTDQNLSPSAVEVGKAEEQKPVTSFQKKIAKHLPDNLPEHPVETNNLEASTGEIHQEIEEWQIPVHSLKLPYKETSSSLTEKITIISGEPQKAEVNEELNRKQLIIYQRLQLLHQSPRHK
jgi:hypothetical protein